MIITAATIIITVTAIIIQVATIVIVAAQMTSCVAVIIMYAALIIIREDEMAIQAPVPNMCSVRLQAHSSHGTMGTGKQ